MQRCGASSGQEARKRRPSEPAFSQPASEHKQMQRQEHKQLLLLALLLERDEDILYEVLRQMDARTLATAACVCRRWRRAAEDETLWEWVCTRDWPSSASRAAQLRSVVLALGGFRRLYALCIRPLLSRNPLASAPSLPSSSIPSTSSSSKQWSKDEVHLSLSLFSIDCYERLGRRYCQQPPLKLFVKPAAECSLAVP